MTFETKTKGLRALLNKVCYFPILKTYIYRAKEFCTVCAVFHFQSTAIKRVTAAHNMQVKLHKSPTEGAEISKISKN